MAGAELSSAMTIMRNPLCSPNQLFAALFLVLAASSFLVLGLNRVNTAVNPGFEDTGSYLEGALVIKEHGGISNFLNLSFSGGFKVESQHPLYLLLLSPFASRDLSFFPKAQLVSLVVGLIVVVSLFLIVADLFGSPAAYIATVLLAFNLPFLERSSVVACETLLIIFVLLTWYLTVKGLDQRRYWMLAGIAGGLAYMTKATGILTLPMFVVSSIWTLRLKTLKDKYVWSFFFFFFLCSCPLLVRNIVVYGTPLYEGANSNVIWLDSYGELSEPKYELLVNWPDHTYTGSNLPTIRSYVVSHSAAAIARRAIAGVIGEMQLLLASMFTVALPRGQRLFAVLVFVLFFVGLIKDRDRRRLVCTISTLVAFFVPAAWYFQVIPEIRFITPLIPLVCIYGAVGCVAATQYLDVRRTSAGPRLSGVVPYVLAAGLLMVAGYLARAQMSRPLLHSVPLSDDQNELFAWLRENVREDDIVVMGPTNRYWGYLWYANFRGSLLPTPGNVSGIQDSDSVDVLTTYLKKRRVSVIVVHKENHLSAVGLGEHFAYDENDGLIERKPIKDWRLVSEYSKKPKAFRIYRLQ